MVKEAYVSFEVARLLKEKGFDEKCRNSYNLEGKFYVHTQWHYPITTMGYVAPTHQMAMKWLREKHNIDIEVHADVGMLGVKVYTPFISRYKSSTEYPSKLRQYKNGLYFEDDRGVIPGIRHFETYEEAVEVALKYTLENLI